MTDPMKFLADPNPPLVLETLLNVIDELQRRIILVEAEFMKLQTQIAQLNTPNTYVGRIAGSSTTWGGDPGLFTSSAASGSTLSYAGPSVLYSDASSVSNSITIDDLRRELKMMYENTMVKPDAPEV